MWASAFDSLEGVLTGLAAVITAVGAVILAVRNIAKNKDPKADTVITQGQSVEPEAIWIQDLRRDADEADELRVALSAVNVSLAVAKERLRVNGLPYEDL